MLDAIVVTAARPSALPVSAARQPRGLIRVNGTAISGLVEFTVANNSFYEADTYHAVLSTSALPSAMDANWFSEATETFIELLAGFPVDPDNIDPNELTSFIYGRIDDLEFDPVERTLTLTGRNLTGAFIDAKIATDYTNQTASAVAQMLATAHGIQYQISPTTTKVGNYYDIDTMQLQAGTSEWDLISKLARDEGYVTFVTQYQGAPTLYFGPDQTGAGRALNLTYVPPSNSAGSSSGNFKSMSFSRSQTVVKGITVTVQSAGRDNPTVRKSYPTAPKGTSPGKASPYGATTNYVTSIASGATPAQCLARAVSIYNEIIRHAMKIKVRLPADEITTVTGKLVVTGTRTSFDQTYYPRSITRTFSVSEGFSMDIDAQSYSPNLLIE